MIRHLWVRGAATLYTREYLELARRHLNPGGVVTEWVPLHESHADAVKSEIATFFEAFPGGTVWANNEDREFTGGGCHLLALRSLRELCGPAIGPGTVAQGRRHQRFPGDLFVASEDWKATLSGEAGLQRR